MDSLESLAVQNIAMPSDEQSVNQVESAKYAAAKSYVDGIIAAGQPWTDPEFPPETNSLYRMVDGQCETCAGNQ